jgi:LPXTG-motif cell wall-anchored protein
MHIQRERPVTLSPMDAALPSLQRLTATLAAVLLAFGCLAMTASTAGAQSAGDEQYADPLGDDGGGASDGGDRPTSDTGADDGSPAPPATGSPSAGSAAPRATESSPTLPRTGAEASVIVTLGVAMLLGGLLLRRRVGTT